MIRYHRLSSDEQKVLCHKGTEPPNTGEYCDLFLEGVYLCRRCDAPLFLSSDKFPSTCGWPSFDDEISGSIISQADNQRTEILCRRCSAHLGHVFVGEMRTEKNIRYCVNSLSLRFLPLTCDGMERCFVAGGCFWGVQRSMKKCPDVVRTEVGYIGGTVVEPTYEEVCSGETSHTEAVEIFFKLGSFENVLTCFLETLEPSQEEVKRQYRLAIFYLSAEQESIANQLVQKRGLKIDITPASFFYTAEESHQDYYS